MHGTKAGLRRLPRRRALPVGVSRRKNRPKACTRSFRATDAEKGRIEKGQGTQTELVRADGAAALVGRDRDRRRPTRVRQPPDRTEVRADAERVFVQEPLLPAVGVRITQPEHLARMEAPLRAVVEAERCPELAEHARSSGSELRPGETSECDARTREALDRKLAH